jgi:DNA polymerase-3 subunit gamma/tau
LFATTESHKIPQTIVSRCQKFDLKRLTLDDIVKSLEGITKQEKIEITAQALYALAREAKGSMRDSQSILEQVISYAGEKIEIDHVQAILGAVDRNTLLELTKYIVSSDTQKSVDIIKKLYKEAFDEKKVVDTLVEIFRELIYVSLNLKDILTQELPDYELKELEDMSKLVVYSDVEQFFYMANQLAEDISKSMYPSMILEVGIIAMSNKPKNKNISDLINSLESSKKKL